MWIKLDDGFATHPKLLTAGPLALAIQVRALCYASQNQTDGFLPTSVIPLLLTGMEHIGIEVGGVMGELGKQIAGMGYNATELDWPTEMIDYGLWEEAEGGYRIHDYLDWNVSKRERDRWKNKLSHAGKRGMKRRWGKASQPISEVITQAITNPVTSPSTSILSSPNPKKKSEQKRESERKGKSAWPDGWTCDEAMQTFAKGFGINGLAEFQRFKDNALTNDRRCKDWLAAYRNWIRKAKDLKEARP